MAGHTLLDPNSEEAAREVSIVVPLLAEKMVNGEGIRPRILRHGSVLVNGKSLQSTGALARLADKIESMRFFERIGPGDDMCSTSGQEEGKDSWKAIQRCIAASIKGFVIGSGLRGGLSLFAILSRLRKKSSVSTKGMKVGVRTDNEAIMASLRETLRYGLFLGTFAGAFCTVDESIAAIGGCRRTGRWRSLVAGAVAGPSLLLTGLNTRHTSMAIYILLRAAVLAARCGIKNEKAGWLCKPLSWKHGDTFLMCLSSCQILSAWIMKPNSLPTSYISFLNKHGGKDLSIFKGINELLFKTKPLTALKSIEEHYRTTGVDIQLDPEMSIPCSSWVSDDSDGTWKPRLCAACLLLFGAFIFPIITCLSTSLPCSRSSCAPRGPFARPSLILSKSLMGIARSSFFLSVYCASAWASTCFLFRTTGMCNPPLAIAATFLPGLAVLIEKKSRRMELALYCLARAIESFAICVTDWGVLERYNLIPPKRLDVFLFSTATAIIMHCYAQERDVFRSKYLNVLDWVFGLPVGATTPPSPSLSTFTSSQPKLQPPSSNPKDSRPETQIAAIKALAESSPVDSNLQV